MQIKLKAIFSKQFVRYIIAGLTSLLFELVVLWFAHDVFSLSTQISVSISFWTGLAVAFMLQKFFTYKEHTKSVDVVSKQMILYGILVAWDYIFTLVFVSLVAPYSTIYIARLFSIVFIVSWNYLIYKKYIFVGHEK